MWPFSSKKSIIKSGVLKGFCDCHCHLLPGVDDGIRSMDDTITTLKAYEEWGVKEVWLTPHVMEDIPNTSSELHARFMELQSVYQGNIRLRLSAEYMLDSFFLDCLRNYKQDASSLITYGTKSDSLLVETSYMQAPIGFRDMLSGITDVGLQPVLAHPERYVYMSENDYRSLHGMGIEMQLNITSLAGTYGKQARDKAEWLLAQGYYNYLGTDCHSLRSLSKAFNAKCRVLPVL